MAEMLTIADLARRFPSEWVLLGEPQTDEYHHVVAGQVLFHSKDRDELYREMLALRPMFFAVRFMGTMPPNTAIVL
jgi:hypothetical protein